MTIGKHLLKGRNVGPGSRRSGLWPIDGGVLDSAMERMFGWCEAGRTLRVKKRRFNHLLRVARRATVLGSGFHRTWEATAKYDGRVPVMALSGPPKRRSAA